MQGDRRFSSVNNPQKQRIKNQQHYLEITRAVQEDLLTSEEELSAIASTTTLTQPSKLDYLWSICEKSQERSKLILSDSLQIPFYLPQNKVVYEKSEVLVEREKKRLEFLIQRDLKELLPGKVKDLDTLLPAKVKLSPREQEISNRVLSEYRHNPERYEQLQRHLQDQKRRKHGQQPPLPFTHSYMEKSVIIRTTEERIQEAKFRREQLLQHELEKKNTLQKDIDEKLIAKKKKMKDILFNPLNTKQKLWLQVIAFTSIMHKTHAKVATYRESKAKDLVKWKNATLIQRTYRRYRERQLGNTQQKIVMKRLRMSMLTINPDSTKLLQGRIDACTIITDFLISIQKNWKNFALNYIRKIKVIQRKWRRHMLQNHFRYLLILSYIEKLIPFLFIHFSFILNGKGYDVQNLLANDMNQLSNSLKYYSFYSITEHIDSSSFHKFLRDINSQHHNPNVLSQILKFFGLLIHSPVHQQHHPKRVDANSNTAISATPKGKLRPTPPSMPSKGFPGHHNHHGKSNSIGAAAAQQIRPYAGLSAINPAVGTIPHPFFSTPEFMELQTPSNYLHQHNIRILTYHATPDPTYHQQYSSNMNFHQTISSQHPFGYSYHKHYTLFDIIVKQCILQFIYKKRAKFIDKMDVNNPVLTHFKFDVNDIKSFIHGEGYDPLQAQLETMMKKQEASFLQHQNYQIQKSLPYGSVKAGSTAVPGGSVAVGSGPGGGNSEIRNAMAEAIATVEQSSSNVPFTSITKDEGRSLAQQRSLLNQQDMEDFDVFGNPHVYKTSQITMLLLSEITAEDIIQLLIEITQILQLIPAPYLGNSNYNQSYIQLLRNQYLKNLKPVEIRKTTTKVPRLSGIDPFNSVMDDRAVVEQELNPSMISSFLFVDDSPVQTPAIVESKGRRGNSTIQKGVPQQLALLVQSNELYRDVYEFFHHYVGRQFPLSSAPTHRSSNATNDLAETRSSREGSVSSQASGASNPVSVAAIAAAAAARQRNAAGANPAQIANLRKSILAGRSDMHRLSVAVASQHAKGAEFLKRKTSVIPENQRKYGKNRRTEGDFDENEDEDDDEEEESDTFGSPLRLSPKQPMRPNFLRKSSVMPVANQHRKLSTLGNK